MSTLDRLRDFIYRRRTAYVALFSGPNADTVLGDLQQFCRANETTFHPDPRIAAMQDGRREVWLRIQNHLNLSPEDLFTLATGQARATASPHTSDEE